MSGSGQHPQQRRRFCIPTVEEIEQNRLETERRLAPSENMAFVNIDVSASTFFSSMQENISTTDQPQLEKQSAVSSTPGTTNANQTAPPVISPVKSFSQSVQVNDLQRGNPLLACIRNVRWSYSKDIVPDYIVGRTSCVLYLSVKYHLLLAWSLDEAGRYIESLKAFENRQPDIIRERVDDNYMARLTNALTSVRSVNKTDVLTLATNFGSFDGVAKATADELTLCPGIGDLKAQRLFKALNEPFIPEK
ncbi:restriction endonuclease type II-like protein [Kickxella alabastrina]|uniref:restriction endonuclease type II-like protein n=1 Tax=Kickxella alabastrina TaxID=61397 RepID=UPI00221E9DAF|nr:restriction endonuclease type II-like protein [Kickxella alabastrina]KAI7828287.1 restriction endonuclease type II-like protein [Kickxella alabastrina]